jgi:hypothetical protein
VSWSAPQDFKAQLLRLWERGELLRDLFSEEARFPLRLTARVPTSAEITDRFEAVRNWAATLATTPPLRVEWQEVRHRVHGLQRLPACVWIDSADEALGWLGKRRERDRFADLLAVTRVQCAAVVPWLEKRPLQALALADEWPKLLAVVNWVTAHPRPGVYLRQVDVPGVHSKFIEAHRALLAELLDLALSPDCVDASKTGVAQFAARYGFRDKPLRIRLRLLDPTIRVFAGLAGPDVTLDADSFSRLALEVSRVIIAENETNFLVLPEMPGTLAIFGAGYGWDALSRARWLTQCSIHYWGDIDTHGFAILDQLRGHFTHVRSFLMDRDTLEAHAVFWGREESPQRADLHRLTPDECDLYNALRDNRIREGLRLEQEYLGFGWVRERLERLSRG